MKTADLDSGPDDFQGRFSSTPQHTSAGDALVQLYQRKGLLPDGVDAPLFECCPNSVACWKGSPLPRFPDDAGISVPWIGHRYFESPVAVLGMNFNNGGGLGAHFWTCEDHQAQMKRGKRGKAGRPFARGVMLALRIVLADLDGSEIPSEEPSPRNEELAELWERCAFLQSIKCSPGTDRSNPTEAMNQRCPR